MGLFVWSGVLKNLVNRRLQAVPQVVLLVIPFALDFLDLVGMESVHYHINLCTLVIRSYA